MDISTPQLNLLADMDSPDRITGWLAKLDIENGHGDVGENGLGDTYGEKKEREEPKTPPRRTATAVLVEQISPTDSSFSSASIFDTPGRKRLLSDDLIRNEECNKEDDGSEFASIDSDSDAGALDVPKTPLSVHQATAATLDLRTPSPPQNIEPHSPLSSTSSNPTLPRLTSLLSCLQCTFSNLPCSRTPPSCTRCTRNGHAPFCLLRRRPFADEDLSPQLGEPVLLKIRGEEPVRWDAKMREQSRLLDVWGEARDRANWVLPSWTRRVGRRRMGERVEEGMGSVVWRELWVDVEGEE